MKTIFKYILLCTCIGLSLSSCKSKKGLENSLGKADSNSVDNEKFQITYFEAQKQKAIENYDKAYEKFQECVALNPDEDAIYYELSKLDTLNSNFSSSLANIKKASNLDPNNLWYSRLQSDIEVELGDLTAALSTLKEITSKDPEDILYRDKLASLASYLSDYKTALTAYNEIESETGINEDLTRLKYYLLLDKGDEEGALNELKKLADAFPNNMVFLRNVAIHYQEAGQLDQALSVYEKITSLDPNDGTTQLALAEFYSAQGNSEKSNEALKLGFADPNATLENKISILFAIIQSKDPKVDTDELVKILQTTHPERGETWSISGDYADMTGNPNDAVEHYKKALDLDPNYKDLWTRVCAMAMESENYTELKSLSGKALTLFPLESDFYYYEAKALIELGETPKGIKSLKNGMDFILDNELQLRKFQIALGKEYFNSAEYQLAQNWLEKAKANGAESSGEVIESLGDTYFQLGNTAQALTYWKQAKNLLGASDLLERKIADEKYIAQ